MENREIPRGDSTAPEETISVKSWGLNQEGLMGFPEAKLFSTRDRATLTFYAGLEVASIHYDRLRDEIFYKGHNVKNMTLTPQQSFYLKNFGACLESEGMDPELCRSYHECLAKVLSYHDTLR